MPDRARTQWAVQTARGTFGPFKDAGEAGRWLAQFQLNLTGPFLLVPLQDTGLIDGVFHGGQQEG